MNKTNYLYISENFVCIKLENGLMLFDSENLSAILIGSFFISFVRSICKRSQEVNALKSKSHLLLLITRYILS